MKREIKFRVWNRKLKMFCSQDATDRLDSVLEYYETTGKETEYPQQFTGLKDKNGIDLYEGDIVRWGHIKGYEEHTIRTAVVEFKPALCFRRIDKGFVGERVFEYGNFYYADKTQQALEIIGHINENPELL